MTGIGIVAPIAITRSAIGHGGAVKCEWNVPAIFPPSVTNPYHNTAIDRRQDDAHTAPRHSGISKMV
ncbi:hypothetical protein DIE03_24705 [Burkholderia sp. Bp8992]|uniref:hypothetical protein n=1 Tax=Burkholderia sp. Bp8992 TaxID=2184554 RepID=UPI000F571710|nr:hypothetical protein [Burkholderia sp. Bp8992]RQS26096.1 hypothetical protein DIE03_24705 [Burkholderia sp. Bp8992]